MQRLGLHRSSVSCPLVLALGLVAWASAATSARAQRRLAHDTLSADTPTVVSCGFCSDEVIGVVFRELSGSAGLRPIDFPLRATSVSLALASAAVTGDTCTTETDGGLVFSDVEIWAGTTPPETLPAIDVVFGEAWSADEVLVWGALDVPIQLSTPVKDGATRFDLQFNLVELADEMGDPIIVGETYRYLRVAMRLLGDGTNSAICAAPAEVPTGFPLRDDDGVIMPMRSFIYGNGLGWRWNESVGLGGDWAIRLEVAPMGAPRDGGTGTDAGTADGGALDGGGADGGADAGTGTPEGGGCTCRVGSSPGGPGAPLPIVIAIAIAARARRRAMLRSR